MTQAIYGYRLIHTAQDKVTCSDWSFVNEPSDNLCVGIDINGNYSQYDSYEAYHVHGWAADHGFTRETCKFDFDPITMTFVQDKKNKV